MVIVIILWIVFLLASINECFKGNPLFLILFIIFNIAIIFAVVSSAKAKNSNDSSDDNEFQKKKSNVTDEDMQDLIFFDMTHKH